MPSSLPITITFATPPEGTCPATFTEAVATLESLVEGNITTSYLPYILGSATPAVEDQNKAWIRTDAAGRPLGTFIFYAGSWRIQYTGRPSEVTCYSGDPSLHFDGTGRGLTTGSWDGWAIANGQNGTQDLSDRMLIGGHMNNVGTAGYSGLWKTNVSGPMTATGGSPFVTLGLSNIPLAARAEIRLDKFTADGNARSNSGALLGHYSGTHDPDGSEAIAPSAAGNASPDVVYTLPPYYALAIVVFIGYS